MAEVNLYDVLNLTELCSTKEIKLSYRELAKIYHPDKPTGDKEMFELITHAYNILVNPKTRQEYDNLVLISKQNSGDHHSLKTQAETFAMTQSKTANANITPMSFQDAWAEMDQKHGIITSHEGTKVASINRKDAIKTYEDMRMAREQDEIEFIQERLFTTKGPIDMKAFNAAFDNMYNKTSVGLSSQEIAQYKGGPVPYSNLGGIDDTYTSIDNITELYSDNIHDNSQFSSVNFESPVQKANLTKADLNTIQGGDYYDSHHEKPKDYSRTLEDRLKERELESKKLDTRNMTDFNTDPNCGGYGIFDGLGKNAYSSITWNGVDNLKQKYDKLLINREKQPK